jgi:RNA polymerase sigma-70 factor, ECF subfamily
METAAGTTHDATARRHRRARAERSTAFGGFYASELRDVTGLVYTLTGSWPAAEDIAQEAFVRAYRDWRRVGTYERPDSWVRTVAVNLATSRGRRLAAEARALTRLRARPVVEETELDADADVFWSAVRRLPRRQAQAVALRYYSDLPVAEIADAMGCAEGTVKAHLHAARQRLADVFATDAGRTDR